MASKGTDKFDQGISAQLLPKPDYSTFNQNKPALINMNRLKVRKNADQPIRTALLSPILSEDNFKVLMSPQPMIKKQISKSANASPRKLSPAQERNEANNKLKSAGSSLKSAYNKYKLKQRLKKIGFSKSKSMPDDAVENAFVITGTYESEELDESLHHSLFDNSDDENEQKAGSLNMEPTLTMSDDERYEIIPPNATLNLHSVSVRNDHQRNKTEKKTNSPLFRPKSASSIEKNKSPFFKTLKPQNSKTPVPTPSKLMNTMRLSRTYSASKKDKRIRYENMDNTLTSYKSNQTSFKRNAQNLVFGKKTNYDADDENRSYSKRLQTAREFNKRFIMDRIQNQKAIPALYRRRSNAAESVYNSRRQTLDSRLSDSPNFEMVKQIPMDYNRLINLSSSSNKLQINTSSQSTPYETHHAKNAGSTSRKQLVYIGGIDDRNYHDVRDRLYDLFEIWGDDRPDISEPNGSLEDEDCIYVRFPSIAQAIDGINVFDGIQPNGYSLSAELVLEGSQIVYIDGLDGDWNEQIFKNCVDINSNYKVSIKKIKGSAGSGDKAYAFVQFNSLEAVQSAIDRFDGETEIDGKLVRWEHMVKAYIGKIGPDTTVGDIQRELSDFDPSFKHLPVEIRKSREPVYYKHGDDAFRYETDITSDDTERRKLKEKYKDLNQSLEEKQQQNHQTSRRKLTFEPGTDSNADTTLSELGGLELPRLPSKLATIESMGHLESKSGSMDNTFNDGNLARSSQNELMSPALRKKFGSMKRERSHSDSEEVGSTTNMVTPVTLVKRSKSTDDLRSLQNLQLPTLMSSEEEPYLSATSMTSMPLYSTSVGFGPTPKHIIEAKEEETSPLVLDAMTENKETIVQDSPLQTTQNSPTKKKGNYFKYTRKMVNLQKDKMAQRLNDSLNNDADDEHLTPNLRGISSTELQNLSINISQKPQTKKSSTERKLSLEEQKLAIPMLDETKSLNADELLSPTITDQLSPKTNAFIPMNNLARDSYSRSVSYEKERSNSISKRRKSSSGDLVTPRPGSVPPQKPTIDALRISVTNFTMASESPNSDYTMTEDMDTKEHETETCTSDTFEPEYEWHHYAYVWFWNKYDAMRARVRFDKRNCFGSTQSPVRFLLMNDMTQKVYVSGLMEGYTNRDTIECDIGQNISSNALWRKKCIITYRANGVRPFAYLRFPSIQATREAIDLFNNQICFGNQRFPHKQNKERIHLELVRDECDLFSNHVGRLWNGKRYWLLTFAFIFLPFTLTYQWCKLSVNNGDNEKHKAYKKETKFIYQPIKLLTAKDMATHDLLSSLFYFNDNLRIKLQKSNFIRFLLVLLSYALYTIFYFLIRTMVYNLNDLDVVFSALLPLFLYLVISQLWSCWCSIHFELAYPQFHALEHVSMYFEDSVLYSRLHVMASDFASAKQWNEIIYPWQYPIEWKKCNVIPAIIYPFMLRLPPLIGNYGRFEFPDHTPLNGLNNNGWDILIEALAATLMFWFCYVLFCVFNTITLRTDNYWKEVHAITELITLKSNNVSIRDKDNGLDSFKFLRLDNENNLFSWLSLRSFIHRKGDVVFCGLEIQGLFLVIMIVLNLATMAVVVFGEIESAEGEEFGRILFSSGFILSQLWFLAICVYYVINILLIGYWFGKENEYQLNRVERQKLFLYKERMKQLLNHEKYKLIDNTKIIDLKLLLNSMEALVQHVQTKEITPQLWGIKMNDFKWKIIMTVIAAVIPSIAVRWMLNVN